MTHFLRNQTRGFGAFGETINSISLDAALGWVCVQECAGRAGAGAWMPAQWGNVIYPSLHVAGRQGMLGPSVNPFRANYNLCYTN